MSTTDAPQLDTTVTALPDGVPAAVATPTARGRWQPVRAGVANSWHWATETFWFTNGSLALVGENGSGKSLTATQLFALLDGAVSEVDLSISGGADGTLTDRHTARQDQARTGVWWLEFSRVDDGTTRHCTLGLWLRARTSQLDRAWFIVEHAREALTLATERTPVPLESLSEQVDDLDGRLFVKASLARAGVAGEDENSYRDAVRETLFDGLDAEQYDALLQVLRTIRSIRSAENITYREMNDLLSRSLPAVDHRRLQELADAMQSLRQLTETLDDERARRTHLRGAATEHTQYAEALRGEVTAELVEAHNSFDHLKGRLKKAEDELGAANELLEETAEATLDAQGRQSEVEGSLQAVRTAMADHAGATLPTLLSHAQQLERHAESAEKRAKAAASKATARKADAVQVQRTVTGRLGELSDIHSEVAAAAADVGADAHLQPLSTVADAAADLELPQGHEDPGAALSAFVQSRLRAAGEINDAVARIAAVNQDLEVAQLRLTEAEDELPDLVSDAEDAADTALNEERSWLEAATEWAAGTHVPAAPPAAWADTDADLDPQQVDTWRRRVRTTDDQSVDLPGAEGRHRSAKTSVDSAAAELRDARKGHRDRLEVLTSRRREADDNRSTHTRLVADAEQALADTTEQATAAAQTARAATHEAATSHARTAAGHRDALQAWADSCAELDPAGVLDVAPLQIDAAALHDAIDGDQRPADVTGAVRDHLEQINAAVAISASDARAALSGQVADARGVVDQVAEARNDVADELAEAQKAPAPPPALPWQPSDRTGAPLWRLVDTTDAVDDIDQLEGALLVAGLLDAVVTADGTAAAGDIVLRGTAEPAADRTLADLLSVDADAAQQAGIDVRAVTSVLHAVAVGADGAVRFDDGHVVTGPAVAAAPAGYQAAHIGAAARERARQARIARLQEELTAADAAVEAAEAAVEALAERIERVGDDSSRLPDTRPLRDSTAALTDLWADQLDVVAAGQLAVAKASDTRDEALRRADADAQRHSGIVAAAEREVKAAAEHVEKRVAAATRAGEELAEADSDLQDAQRDAAAVDAHHASFPTAEPLWAAYRARRAATEAADRARTAVKKAEAKVAEHRELLTRKQTELSQIALLDDGTVLPTLPRDLRAFENRLGDLDRCVGRWRVTWTQVRSDVNQAVRAHDDAEEAAEQAADDRVAADDLTREARRARAEYDETRRVAGAEYEQLSDEHQKLTDELGRLKQKLADLREQEMEASNLVAATEMLLQEEAPRLEKAETRRTAAYARLRSAVDHGLVTVDEETETDDGGRPKSFTGALAYARRVYGSRSATGAADALTEAQERLESRIRMLSKQMAEHNEEILVRSLPSTPGWKGCTVQQTDGSVARDIHRALEDTERRITKLGEDLNDRLRRTVKATLLTDLRRDVNVRMELARTLVADTRRTLKGLRTGVANVGIELDWKPADDDNAQQMIQMMAGPPTSEVIDRMWETLKEMLDEETEGPLSWTDRVAAVFDYRRWFTWKIRVTHNDFSDAGDDTEAFKEWTRYRNPLKDLSTGERRLATLLPPLSAAHSLYAVHGFTGARMLLVDEVDATFDDKNLRQLLGLLAEWDFDTLMTAPKLAPLIKPEIGKVVLHEIVAGSAQSRLTVPWWYDGRSPASMLLS